jgi:two-component system, OmpR family, sensor histidine kinase VicK
MPSPKDTIMEKVEIISDRLLIASTIADVIARAKNFISVCIDKNALKPIGINQCQQELAEAHKRGITIKYVTEITKENLEYCKELMEIAQVYHIDAIRGNFVVTDQEYLGTAILKDGKFISQLIYSDSKQILEQQKFLIDALSEKAIPALQRIKEIEEFLLIERTKVVYGEEQIVNMILCWQQNAQQHWNLCVDSAVPNFSMSEKIRKGYSDAKARGIKIKYITEITKDNRNQCKEIMKYAEVRHLAGVIGNFVVSDKEYLGEAVSKDFFSHLVYSNKKEIVDQQNYVFKSLWDNAIPQEDKIRQIEEGIEPEEIKILSNPMEIQQLYRDLLESAISELSLIVSTPDAFLRQQKIGIIDLIKKAAIERNVKVNLIIPKYENQNQNKLETEIEDLQIASDNIHVRKHLPSISQTSTIKSTILLADRQYSLLIDFKDVEGSFRDVIGFATYSNNKSRTQSYGFIFDTIWRQADVYEELEMKTIELEKLNTMQNEFINIAAHELRTPTQAILGYSDMLEQSSERNQSYEKTIARNAQRLHILATDILDVARIESRTLKLNKSSFGLNQEAENVIKDVMERREWEKNSNSVKFIFEPKESIILFGDKQRIYQVLFNLVNNALKFTENGTITIAIEKQKNNAVITVTDTGLGIDKTIQPRIFSKFVTKSNSGTGLGLFISKAIVEAHGGHIQASNNLDGKGATFLFNLPLNS